jgi:hypothetical protein
MKKLSMIVALAVTLIALPAVSAYADASQNGCEHSGNRAAGCTDDTKKKEDPARVPEPTSFALLTVGVLACGGAAVVFGRKRLVQN